MECENFVDRLLTWKSKFRLFGQFSVFEIKLEDNLDRLLSWNSEFRLYQQFRVFNEIER